VKFTTSYRCDDFILGYARGRPGHRAGHRHSRRKRRFGRHDRDGAERSRARGELFRRDQSDLDGTFTLGTVILGEYTIVAIENGWDLNWSQPGVIAHYLKNGGKVVIAPTAQEPVRLSEPVEVQSR